jgi:hypothetical protein
MNQRCSLRARRIALVKYPGAHRAVFGVFRNIAMKRFWQLLALGLSISAVSSTVSAQMLGLNFASTDPDAATSSLLPTEAAGVISHPNWNNFMGASGTNVGSLVYDNNGTAVPSTATVSWTSPNTWRSGGNNLLPAGPQRKLMSGYIDTGDTTATAVSVTVNNIDPAILAQPYDVYVYFVSDSGDNRGGGYTLTPVGGASIVKYGSTMNDPTTHIEDPGTDTDNSIDGTYLKYTGLTAASFTIVGDATLTTPGGFRAPINAIQLGRPLVAGDVNGDGAVNINDFHIIRSNLFKTGQSRAQGDIVGGNGVVDFADYREWKIRAGAGGAGASLSVPEPGAWLLLAIGASLLASRRGKRSSLQSGR